MNYLRRRDLLPVTGFDTERGGETEKEGKDKTGGEGFETTKRYSGGREKNMGRGSAGPGRSQRTEKLQRRDTHQSKHTSCLLFILFPILMLFFCLFVCFRQH